MNIDLVDESGRSWHHYFQLKFGPSAWFANEQDPDWTHRIDPALADYSKVILTNQRTKQLWQTDVSLRDISDGLDYTDRRFFDLMTQVLPSNWPLAVVRAMRFPWRLPRHSD